MRGSTLAQFFVPHVKNTFAALAVLFSVGFLFLALFASGTVSRPNQHVPAASHTDASIVKLETPPANDRGFVLKSYGKSTPGSGVFLTAKKVLESAAEASWSALYF